MHFEYVVHGINVKGIWYPIVRMEWVEGESLSNFVGSSLNDPDAPDALRRLAAQWRGGPAASLRGLRIAHNDLQHGNVMVQGDGSIRLVDYDGIFLPRFRGERSPEEGHKNFQHPDRTAKDYDAYVDNFPSLVIYLSLLAIAADPDLWAFYNEDNLILTQNDYSAPGSSEVFKRLKSSPDPTVKTLTGRLEEYCALPVKDVPDLEAIQHGATSPPEDTLGVAEGEGAAGGAADSVDDGLDDGDVAQGDQQVLQAQRPAPAQPTLTASQPQAVSPTPATPSAPPDPARPGGLKKVLVWVAVTVAAVIAVIAAMMVWAGGNGANGGDGASGGDGVGGPSGQRPAITAGGSAPAVTLNLSPPSIGEDGESSRITASLSAPSSVTTTVTVSAAPGAGADPGDYSLSGTTLTIAPLETASAAALTLSAIDNAVDAPDKTVHISGGASNALGVIDPAAVALTITDDDGAPTVTLDLSPTSISENVGTASVTAFLSSPSPQAVTVVVSASPVSPAVAGDFAISSNKILTIAPGSTSSTGTVTITGVDNGVDAPDKSVTVSADVSGGLGVIAPSSRTLTITDDEGAPTVTLDLSSSSISENGGSANVTASLSGSFFAGGDLDRGRRVPRIARGER